MPDDREQEGQSTDLTNVDPDPEELQRLLDSVPAEFLSEALRRRKTEITQVASVLWQAPQPPAAMLREYDDISPGFADRIISSSEREQAHRHDCEKSGIGASIQAERRGQWMGFSIAVLMILVTSGLIYLGQNLAGSIFGGITLIGLVSLFTTGRLWPMKTDESNSSESNDGD